MTGINSDIKMESVETAPDVSKKPFCLLGKTFCFLFVKAALFN